MDVARATVDAISDLLSAGLAPIPALKHYGIPFSLFDLVGSMRLALVLRQIRDAELAKARELQEKLKKEDPSRVREIEEPYFIKDFVTILTVIWGGELVCAGWLEFTPSFLTGPIYPLLFIGAQAVVNLLPSVPPMSLYTELPLSFFDALTRAFLLTDGNPTFVLTHSSTAIQGSPWALMTSSLVLANSGFFFVNVFQMLSPYGWHVKTPPEFLPGGWRAIDLWIAPLLTGVYAFLTHAQPFWVPYHTYAIQRVGTSSMFGSIVYPESVEGIDQLLEPKTSFVKPMAKADARSICVLVLAALFAYRAIANFGMEWIKAASARTRRKRVIRSKHDGKRLSKDNIKINHKSG